MWSLYSLQGIFNFKVEVSEMHHLFSEKKKNLNVILTIDVI